MEAAKAIRRLRRDDARRNRNGMLPPRTGNGGRFGKREAPGHSVGPNADKLIPARKIDYILWIVILILAITILIAVASTGFEGGPSTF